MFKPKFARTCSISRSGSPAVRTILTAASRRTSLPARSWRIPAARLRVLAHGRARKRNPRILLDCLPWSYPGWISSPFSQDSADWYVAFLDVARKHYGLKMDWVAAAWNEHGTDLNWIAKTLRPTLDAHGYADVKLQAPDNNGSWQI